MDRRKFLKASLLSSAVITPLFGKDFYKSHFVLPKKPFEYFHKKAKKSKFRVMLIGGIHGNEMGAYKAADMLIDATLEKGELLIIPRSNFTSVLADVRGYNGDMNRKFEYISKKDPDFYAVGLLKEAILNYKPDILISMHDGYGFNLENKKDWGQSVVIDERQYKHFNLYSEAEFVRSNANKYLHKKLSLINTKTFTSHIHDEQKKALTGWCLEHNIKAFCIEASKQLPNVDEKIKTHLVMLREFFKLYDVKIKELDEMIKEPSKFIDKRSAEIAVEINSQKYKYKKSAFLKVPKGSSVKIAVINGPRGVFPVPRHIDLNWKSFHAPFVELDIKNDYQKLFNLKIKA